MNGLTSSSVSYFATDNIRSNPQDVWTEQRSPNIGLWIQRCKYWAGTGQLTGTILLLEAGSCFSMNPLCRVTSCTSRTVVQHCYFSLWCNLLWIRKVAQKFKHFESQSINTCTHSSVWKRNSKYACWIRHVCLPESKYHYEIYLTGTWNRGSTLNFEMLRLFWFLFSLFLFRVILWLDQIGHLWTFIFWSAFSFTWRATTALNG